MYIIYQLFFLWMKKKVWFDDYKNYFQFVTFWRTVLLSYLFFSLLKEYKEREKEKGQYFDVHILIMNSSRFMFVRIVGIQPKSLRCTMSTWRRPIHTHLPSWSSMISDTSSSVTTTSQTCCSLATEKTTFSCHDLQLKRRHLVLVFSHEDDFSFSLNYFSCTDDF